MSLKDKVIIVTGAGRGLGKMYARALSQQGGKLAVIEVNSKDVEQSSRDKG